MSCRYNVVSTNFHEPSLASAAPNVDDWIAALVPTAAKHVCV